MTKHEWEDLGWEKMSALLDKELPPPPRSNRKWYWTLLLLLLPLAYCGWSRGGFKGGQSDEEPVLDRPLAAARAVEASRASKSLDTEGGHAERPKQFAKAVPTAVKKQPDSKKEVVFEQTTHQKAPDMAASWVPGVDTATQTSLAEATVLTDLPSLEGLFLTVSEYKAPIFTEKKSHNTHRNIKGHFEVSAALLASRTLRGDCVGGQWIQPLSPQYVLSGGLSYRYMAFNSTDWHFWSLSAQSDVSATTTTSALSQGRAFSVQSLHYLDLPLSIRRQVNDNWSVGLGFRASRLLNIGTAGADTANVWIANTGSAAFANQTADKLGVSQWDMALQARVGYQFRKRHHCYFQADLGLKIAMAPESSFFSLGYAYAFLPKKR